MQILQLHLRNIASIIEADIDFTKDLKDGVTGDPASLFLICGDTGAGKSVILDGISMALYKDTPRLKGVNGRKNNSFKSKDGDEISMTDIQQYTRIGISHKDECYSEVVFEGNDGITYQSRLSLGVNRNRNLRKPTWNVKIGNDDWISGVNECQAVIRQAVGLSFDQFSRMVMLAQGQFAAFLTGDKDSREIILEQLTDTKRFSTYGTAVHNIYKKAETEKNNKQTQFDIEAEHLLSEEKLQEDQDDKVVFLKQRTFADQRKEKATDRLSNLRRLIENRNRFKQVQTKIKELEMKQRQENYLADVTFIEAWEKTNDVRLRLKDLKEARNNKKNEEKKSAGQAQTFTLLSCDLMERRNRLFSLKESITRQEKWLDEKSSRLPLYDQAGAIKEQLHQYGALLDTIAANQSKLKKEQEKAEGLTQNADAAKMECEKATKALKKKEAEIEKHKNELDAYNLNQINKDISCLKDKKATLEHLGENIEKLQEELKTLKGLEEEIKKDKEKLTTLEQEKKAKADDYHAASEDYDQINGQFSTMKASVNDMIKSLRAKIVSEGIDTCPLCGQHIETKIDETDFEQILAPWREKENAARAKRDEAQKASRLADKAYNDLTGKLKGEIEGINGYGNRLLMANKTEEMLKKRVEDNGLTYDNTLHLQLKDARKKMDSTLASLTSQQQTAIRIQDVVNRLQNEKKPLESAQQNTLKALTKCEQNITENKIRTANLLTLIGEAQTKKAETEETLANALNDFYPRWNEQPAYTGETLYNDSELYKSNKRNFDIDINKRQHQETLLKQIEAIQCELAALHPEWKQENEAKLFESKDILSEWVNLKSSVSTNDRQIEESMKKVTELTAVIVESGRTEEELEQIEAQEYRIDSAKKMINQICDELKHHKGSRAELYKQIQAGVGILGLEHLNNKLDDDDSSPYDELLTAFQTEKTNADNELELINLHLTEINNRLATNESDRERLKEYQRQLEEATKRQNHWKMIDDIFGGSKFRTLVQTFILSPLLNIANQYLERITDRYLLTCDEQNEQLSILVLDRYNKNQVRSATVLSGGETFMISLALSLALSSLNSQGMNVNILFIDEGFGTLDEKSLDSVMSTLEKLQEIAGQSHRRVGIISHREELLERIPIKIKVEKKGEGRSQILIENSL